MRVFKKPNLSHNWKCPICKTADVKEVVLVGIVGTEDDGICEVEQIHINCIDLIWDKDMNIIYQSVVDRKLFGGE